MRQTGSYNKNINEKQKQKQIIDKNKTASDTALVELTPGNALDTVDLSISINK